MHRGTLATRLAALPLTVIACATTGTAAAPAAPSGPPADCAAFATAYNTQIAANYGKPMTNPQAITLFTTLAGTLTSTDRASATVRADALAVVGDLRAGDVPGAETAAMVLESDASTLLLVCGPTGRPRGA